MPFDNFSPQIDKNKKSFLYAASSVTDYSIEKNGCHSDVFSHTEDINLMNFIVSSPNLMWNSPIYMGKLGDFKPETSQFFIRALIDSKWIAGTVMTKEEFLEWKFSLVKINFNMRELIFVAECNQPEAEYRLFFVNRKYSTGSRYKKDFTLSLSQEVPSEVIELATDFSSRNEKFLPNSFVVDVGCKDKKLGIIEVNGINNSGFYLIDKEKLIQDLISCE